MKSLLFLTLLLLPFLSQAQTGEAHAVDHKKHKIVIQLTSGDTLVQKSLMKQVHNLLVAGPNSKIEVVCHNNGISLLQSAQTKQAAQVREMAAKGVVFAACENTMRERKIARSELLPESVTVPSGVFEVVQKQEKGWSYLRAGQ
jgi:intracellular sulfur oxidation DsrE/DsrF family protein